MRSFYLKSMMFWGVLLVVAVINAVLRETTYKPLLTPMIGGWAHQISSVTGIVGFFLVIYWFLKRSQYKPKNYELVTVGLIWIVMTIIFESWMNMYVRKLSFQQVLETYYFWKGDLWFFVLMSLLVSPLFAKKLLKL